MPKSIDTRGELITVSIVNIVEEENGFVADLSADTHINKHEAKFKAEVEAGIEAGIKGTGHTKQTQLPKLIVEKAFNHPEFYKVKIFRDGSVEIESRDNVNMNHNDSSINQLREYPESPSKINSNTKKCSEKIKVERIRNSSRGESVAGKLWWNGRIWERQVILYNNTPKPQSDHPVWRYVKSLQCPDNEGKVENYGYRSFAP